MLGLSYIEVPPKLQTRITYHFMNGDFISAKKIINDYTDSLHRLTDTKPIDTRKCHKNKTNICLA